MTETVVAVVGTGNFVREHLQALAAMPDVRVSHVVGRDLAQATATAALAPGAVPTTDPAAVLGDPAVHAVDICNATPGHAPWTVAAARAGKHVHVEKPVCTTLSELALIERAVTTSGVSFMVGQTVRFQPAVAELKAQLDAGAIGDPRLAHISWYTGYNWPGGWRTWQFDTAQSGGHPVHNGTHALDAAGWLLDARPERVFCRPLPTWAADMPTPDSFQVTVRYADGQLATIELCYALRTPGDSVRRLMVAGTTGSLLHSTEGERELHHPQTPDSPASTHGALAVQLRHWIDTLHGAEPVVTFDQVRSTLHAALAAQRSLTTGRAVTIQEIADEHC